MKNEAFVLSPVSEDYYIQSEHALIPATGVRAYVLALPELTFFYEEANLTEARTGMKFAEAGDIEELVVEVSCLLEKVGPDEIRRLIALQPSIEERATAALKEFTA